MYVDEVISDDASLMMTVVGVTGSLSRLVNIYDFRLGRTEALSKLLSTIVDISVNTARDMLKDSSPSPADERNLTQTLASKLHPPLMEVCYDRKAKEISRLLKDKTLAEKRALRDAVTDPRGDRRLQGLVCLFFRLGCHGRAGDVPGTLARSRPHTTDRRVRPG